jgi:hypothetical protein
LIAEEGHTNLYDALNLQLDIIELAVPGLVSPAGDELFNGKERIRKAIARSRRLLNSVSFLTTGVSLSAVYVKEGEEADEREQQETTALDAVSTSLRAPTRAPEPYLRATEEDRPPK